MLGDTDMVMKNAYIYITYFSSMELRMLHMLYILSSQDFISIMIVDITIIINSYSTSTLTK